MEWRKRIRVDKDGVSVAADVNAAIAINQGEPGATNKVDSVSHVRVVQDSRRRTQTQSGADAPETEQEDTDA
jgi:hypothetical protein